MLDNQTLALLSGKFIIGILIFVRIAGIIGSSPFFKYDGIPMQVKIMLSVILAISVTSTFWKEQPTIDFHLWNMVFLVMKELLMGLIIGFSANTVFFAANFAGGLVDNEMGFQTGALFNPENTNPTILGEFKEIIVIIVFLLINGHHYIIEAIYLSVRAVPVTTFAISETTVHYLVVMATSILMIGIKLSSPMLLAMFVTNLSLALLSRVAPQTNIFALSFQFKIAVGLIVLFISIPLFVMVAKFSLSSVQTEMLNVIMSLNPKRV